MKASGVPNPYFESGNIVISDREGFFLVKASSLGTEENKVSDFSIYPNPASNNINISSLASPITTIKIL